MSVAARLAEAMSTVSTVPVVLLGRNDAMRAHLRTALTDFGAQILHEGDIASADCNDIIARHPSVVLINLEAGAEDALDALDPLFAASSINVVFNEAEASSQLAGWDLARWARHLASKVLGHNDTAPPRPFGAEPLPERNLHPEPGAPLTPAQEVGDVSMDGFAAEAANSEYAVPTSRDLAAPEPLVEAVTIAAAGQDSAVSLAPTPQIARDPYFLADPDADPAVSLQSMNTEDARTPSLELERNLHFGADGDIDAIEVIVEVAREVHGGPAATEYEGVELDIDLDFDQASNDSSEHGGLLADVPLDASALDGYDLEFELPDDLDAQLARGSGAGHDEPSALSRDSGGLDLDFDLAAERPLPVIQDDAELDLSMDPDVAALAAQLDDISDSPQTGDGDGLEFDFSSPGHRVDALASGDAASHAATEDDSGSTPSTPAANGGFSLSGLTLASMDDDEPAAEDSPAKSSVAPAPKPPSYDFSSLSMSLEPMPEESIEGETGDAQVAATVSPAHGGDTGPGLSIPRVIVLGASIGGPDAVRTFLGHLPASFPALIVLCQHLESGFFTRLAEQLQKVSKLPVRVAAGHSDPARAGELLVIPSTHRFSIDEDGCIQADDYPDPPHYKPCIDDIMRAVADQFGDRVTAIVFSGMAGDAIEGAVHVTARGGEVWAQDPASCVVSSMVDGAKARGVVEFFGSPRELAEQCIKRYGRRS
jgi:chemotaxis response regulator CheB